MGEGVGATISSKTRGPAGQQAAGSNDMQLAHRQTVCCPAHPGDWDAAAVGVACIRCLQHGLPHDAPAAVQQGIVVRQAAWQGSRPGCGAALLGCNAHRVLAPKWMRRLRWRLTQARPFELRGGGLQYYRDIAWSTAGTGTLRLSKAAHGQPSQPRSAAALTARSWEPRCCWSRGSAQQPAAATRHEAGQVEA